MAIDNKEAHMLAGIWYVGNCSALPYGTRSVAPIQRVALAYGHIGKLNRPGAPVALRAVSASGVLRMCDTSLAFSRSPTAQDLANASAQMDFLQKALVNLAGMHDRPLLTLVNEYFHLIRLHVSNNSAPLRDRLGDLSGLAEPLHWAFLAPMPLPLAHLAPMYDAESSVIDLAFWTEAGVIAIFADRGSLTPGKLRMRDALLTNGVRVIDASAYRTISEMFLSLGSEFTDFIGDAALPSSPFVGMQIAVPKPD